MENNDFDIFKHEVNWFFKPIDNLDFAENNFSCSDNFIITFPTLHNLISKARILDITLTRKKEKNHYKLFSWTKSDGSNCGWLCKVKTSDNQIELLYEHQLLLNYIGGIQESYNQYGSGEAMLTDNQNFIFTKSECHVGLNSWADFYQQACEEENIIPIDTTDFICFAGETNGNETYYNLKTKQIFLFAPDHSFNNVKVLNGQPEYTFYTINNVISFHDYAETVAQQWLENIAFHDP